MKEPQLKKLLFVFVLFVCLLPTQTLKSKERMVEARQKAVLDLSMSALQVPLGAPVLMTVRLRNTGAKPLWCNQRLSHNAAYAPEAHRELVLEVVGPDGKDLSFACLVRALGPQRSDYGLLQPGEAAEAEIKVSRCYPMKQPGRYRIVVTYKDGNDEEIPRPPRGAVYLKEELRAGPIEVEILPQ